MKKIVKMSLVAAVAVAGLTTANAKPLEEAIKNVDVSGTVGFRYDNWSSDTSTTEANKYKVALNLSSKVNDNLKVNTRVIISPDFSGQLGYGAINARADGQDTGFTFSLANVYFGYTGIKNTTINLGKQGVATPWTVARSAGGSDASEQSGTGLSALTTWGPITVAGAFYNQTNLNLAGAGFGVPGLTGDFGPNDIATLGIMAKAGPVALDVWTINLANAAESVTVGAKTSFNAGSVKLGAGVRYTTLDQDGSNDTDSLVKVMLSLKAGIFNAGATFAATGEDGGLTAFDRDASTTFQGWAVSINGKRDASLFNIVLGVKATNKLHLAVIQNSMEGVTSAADEEETILKAVYKMSKNLATIVMLSSNDVRTIEQDRGRLELVYSF